MMYPYSRSNYFRRQSNAGKGGRAQCRLQEEKAKLFLFALYNYLMLE
jgi:hypothetical protein